MRTNLDIVAARPYTRPHLFVHKGHWCVRTLYYIIDCWTFKEAYAVAEVHWQLALRDVSTPLTPLPASA